MRPSVPARIGSWIIALLVGLVYGVAGTVAHAYAIGWFPLGLILAVIGSAALLVAVRLLTSDRWATLAVAIGLMTATLVFSGAGPGGSVVVPQAPEGEFNAGIVWTILVPIISALVIAWPDMRSRADAASEQPV